MPRSCALLIALIATVCGTARAGETTVPVTFPGGHEIDPSVGMHRLARRRIRKAGIRVEHQAVSGEHLPFRDDTFDDLFTYVRSRTPVVAL